MIVTVCLSKGALAMSRKKVIVKRINAIQNLGATDVLCTDKTGTLTMDHVILEKHCDVALKEDEGVLALAYMNSHFQTGLRNVLDRAVLVHTETHSHAKIPEYAKVDEIPFDFQRRIMSVVVRTPEGKDRIISKGAPEAIFPCCAHFDLDGTLYPMDHAHIDGLKKEYEQLSADGFRVLAIASKHIKPRGIVAGDATPYSKGRRVRPDPERLCGLPGSAVNRDGRRAASRSVVGSCRTALANSPTMPTGWAAARLGSRVPHRHCLRPSQRHSLTDAPAGTRVRVGDDVLASLAGLATGGRVGSDPFCAPGLARTRRTD
jgi:Cation transport ATPase (P-type)